LKVSRPLAGAGAGARPVYRSLTVLRSGSFLKVAKDNSCGSAS
jgi:hypothetical protein